MKHKSEIAKILKNLCQSMKRQFEVNIQGFRTENAEDFFNNELREFFEHEGIDMKPPAYIRPNIIDWQRGKYVT